MMKKIISATESTRLGYAMMNLGLAHDGGNGPQFITRRHNPREATTESLKDVRTRFNQTYGGLIKDNANFALSMGIRLPWIKNQDEIWNYRPQDGGPPPNIEWAEQAKEKVADLFNGNHQYKLLLENLADALKQLDDIERRMAKISDLEKPTKMKAEQKKVDENMNKQVLDTLQKEGKFALNLFDLGMWYDLCELQLVGIHGSFRCCGGLAFERID
jgi:hypothetical protein